MTEREQFIRAICEEPWRDDVRLVYSDWLEERGEAERAEFIKTQIELAYLEAPNKFGIPMVECRCGHNGFAAGIWKDKTCRPCKLRYREQESLRAHNPKDATPNVSNYSAWFDPFWKTLKNAKWEYRRGFVHTINCRLTDWFGEECKNCEGRGRFWIYLGHGDHDVEDCEKCDGRGCVGAHGPAIAACQPVERVEFADKEPSTYQSPYRNRWSWFNTEVPGTDRNDCLPGRVLRLLEGFDNRGATPNTVKWYNSQEDAITALSNAAVNWARREAGLPKLKFSQAGLALAGEGW